MVKSVLGVSHQGLRDWIIQRLSAIVMAVYSISLIAYLIYHGGLDYNEWRGLFSFISMKIATIFMLLSIMAHAWIGMWTIFTDYVKPFLLRCILHTFVLFMLSACFIWGILILWSV